MTDLRRTSRAQSDAPTFPLRSHKSAQDVLRVFKKLPILSLINPHQRCIFNRVGGCTLHDLHELARHCHFFDGAISFGTVGCNKQPQTETTPSFFQLLGDCMDGFGINLLASDRGARPHALDTRFQWVPELLASTSCFIALKVTSGSTPQRLRFCAKTSADCFLFVSQL